MRGELIVVWFEAGRDIWDILASEDNAPDDLFCELYRELDEVLKKKATTEELADIIDNSLESKEKFYAVQANELAGERALVSFFEKVHEVLVSRHEPCGGDNEGWNITKSPCQSQKEPSCRPSQAKARTPHPKSSMP